MSLFDTLQKEHQELLTKQGSDADILDDVNNYLKKIGRESAKITIPQERDQLRANLRYWSGFVYSQTGEYPDIELAPAEVISERESQKRINKWLIVIPFALIAFPLLIYGIQQKQENDSATPTVAVVAVVPTETSTVTPTPSVTPTLTSTPTASSTATATPTDTVTPTTTPKPEVIPTLDTTGIVVQLTNLQSGEEVRPRMSLTGIYQNLRPGWSIHVLLQPFSQGGKFFPNPSYFSVPTSKTSGEWTIEVIFGKDPNLDIPEQYNIRLVVATDNISREILESAANSGFTDIPLEAVPFPQIITVNRGTYDHIEEVRVIFQVTMPDSVDIATMRLDGSDFRLLSNTFEISELAPRLSPNGRQIAFVGRQYANPDDKTLVYSLWIMDSDGENRILLVSNLQVDETSPIPAPVWSPDGHYIAYNAHMPDQIGEPVYQLFLYDIETSESEQITFSPGKHVYPSWLPGSEIIVYRSTLGLYRINIFYRVPILLYEDPDAVETHPVVSSDGRKIAFTFFTDTSAEGNRDIYVLDLESGTIQRMTTHTGLDWLPSWHPDGQTIYFESHRDTGIPAIWAIDTDGTNIRRISTINFPVTSPYVGRLDVFLPRESQ